MNSCVTQLEISGAEGGGQLLRSALSLSLCTNTPFTMTGIRAGRERPGLLRQHLTAVEAARAVGMASVQGATPGSKTLSFIPGDDLQAGRHHFRIGTAGSTTLVLQTILPPLWQARESASVTIEGGTHNPMAPPVDFLNHTYAPLLRRMGVDFEVDLIRHGFAPAGGGQIQARITPGQVRTITLNARSAPLRVHAQALLSSLPSTIGERELAVVAQHFHLSTADIALRSVPNPRGPGNTVTVFVECETHTEVFTEFGEFSVSSERVAEKLCQQVDEWLHSDAAVSAHVADQLLLPMALAGGGEFTTTAPTNHLRTNAALIEKFLPVEIEIEALKDRQRCWQVRVVS